jgi:hypothetical protein
VDDLNDDLDEKAHGYLDHTFFGTARSAMGARVAPLGWALGVLLVVVGVWGGAEGWPLLVVGALVLLGMGIGAVRRLRDRRQSEEISRRPPMDVPHHPASHPEVHLHLDVPHPVDESKPADG